ncbi:AMP-binding domain protein [Salinisphaera sp. T5B8]|uniref:AMP-binding protein n=1 Tax=unclassified Salinisphaera TaxID=2649847 RepID=UPI00333F3C67
MTSAQPSYAHGAYGNLLSGQTIGQAFDTAAAAWPDRLALVSRHQSIRLTYAQLKQQVDRYAAAFVALGLAPGDRIGIWSHNCAEWLITQYATAKAGLVLVNINPAYRRAEVEYALNKVGCRALVVMPQHSSSDYLGMLAGLAPELADCAPGALRSAALPCLEIVIRLGDEHTPGMLNFNDLPDRVGAADTARVDELAGLLQADDAINIQFTSGTTGQPKGATLSHHNILNNGLFVGEGMGLTADDRVAVPVPLYHCFGMVMGNLGALTHGAAVVYPAPSFEPGATLEAVAAERCTALYGVPTMFIAEMGVADFVDYDLSCLRTGIMAGSPCPQAVMQRVIDEMHMQDVIICYGMTETSPVSCQTAMDDDMQARVSTVGRVLPHLEIKIVDIDGRVVARGEPGEYCTRGYSVMLAYWDDATRTAEAIDAARWMHTGDLAVMDEAGYCRIVGRLKDMVIRGGENIYPREIEEYLYRHPAVADVQVVGVPDERFGEELCAWVQLAAGQTLDEGALRAFCEGEIAHYKIPRYIRFVESFPLTVTGKVQKYRMREYMIDELGLA